MKHYETKIDELKKESRLTRETVENSMRGMDFPIARERSLDREADRDLPRVTVESNEQKNLTIIKEKLRKIAKDKNLPAPKDIITTANRKILFKMNNLEDAQILERVLKEEDYEEINSVKLSKFKKYRMILFGLNKDFPPENAMEELNKIPELIDREFEFIRAFIGGGGTNNVVFDVDGFTRSYFLSNPRLCMDYIRVRISPYITINRCYNCFEFTHSTNRCKNRTKCGHCGGDHRKVDCDEEMAHCVNCKTDNDHSSDSKNCPPFAKHKNMTINNASQEFEKQRAASAAWFR